MNGDPVRLSLDQWDTRYEELRAGGLNEPHYGGPLRRHADGGDRRLCRITFDPSKAALRLWNFLLTEEERLRSARSGGKKIVGAMKDLGTVPVMAFSSPELVAFYPDGAWWLPCFKELNTDLLSTADSLGLGEAFCPVRAMVGAFISEKHFPLPDFLTCSVGATCDDFSAIAQRLHSLGFPILWWEMPHRRPPGNGEASDILPGGTAATRGQIEFVRSELERVREALGNLAREPVDDAALSRGIRAANRVRRCIGELRHMVFTAPRCPLPALEMLIAEMMALHFCSDRDECLAVLEELKDEVGRRVTTGHGILDRDAARLFWVNPVADLRVMNLLEEWGGRICGTDYLFFHALDEIPEDISPMDALAMMALADPMTGSAADRARRIIREIRLFGAEGLVISRIPGASHCATEGIEIAAMIRRELGIPVTEIEVPPVADSLSPVLRNRLEAIIEVIKERRVS